MGDSLGAGLSEFDLAASTSVSMSSMSAQICPASKLLARSLSMTASIHSKERNRPKPKDLMRLGRGHNPAPVIAIPADRAVAHQGQRRSRSRSFRIDGPDGLARMLKGRIGSLKPHLGEKGRQELSWRQAVAHLMLD
jgi:hypothetical protein